MLRLSAGVNQNYKIISRWLHKTLIDWQSVLKEKGADVMIYEEYIDFTTNQIHFDKFILLLIRYCPNLTHVRLLFSGESGDCLEEGFVNSLLQLPTLKCLSLFDCPNTEISGLNNSFNQLTTLKIAGIDPKVATSDFSNILGSMKHLRSLIYEYKSLRNDQIVSSLSNLPNLKNLSLYYAPESELKHLKNCNQLEKLHLYFIDDGLSADDFLSIFKEKRKLHTLSISLIDNILTNELSKLGEYCPQLTYLTVNQQLESFGDFVNLKYLKFDMVVEASLPIFETQHLIDSLYLRYADRLQVLDISRTFNHTHTVEITKLSSLKAFLCSSWPRNMYHCLTELKHLQFFSMETYFENLDDTEELMHMTLNCTNLRYLRLPYTTYRLQEFILRVPNYLTQRGFQPEFPFLLSLASHPEEKLKEHTSGNILQLECNGKIFASKLKDLIASLSPYSEAHADDEKIFKYPGKMPGDPIGSEDSWLSSMNYKLALKSCTNKHNLDLDQELITRCRSLAINNAECDLSTMQYAYNFKYDTLDGWNECTEEICD